MRACITALSLCAAVVTVAESAARVSAGAEATLLEASKVVTEHGGRGVFTDFTPPLPTRKHLRAAQWNFSAFVHFGPTTFLPQGVDNNCFTNATTNVTAPIASVELFNPTGVSS